MLKTLLGPEGLFRTRHGPLFRRATTAKPPPSSDFVQMFRRRRPAADSFPQFMRWYSPGRHAGGQRDRARHSTRAARDLHGSTCRQATPPTPDQPSQATDGHPARRRPRSRRDRRAICRSVLDGRLNAVDAASSTLTEPSRGLRLHRRRRNGRSPSTQPRLFGPDQTRRSRADA